MIFFSRTGQERLAQHDPRPSLQERYRTYKRYVAAFSKATKRAMKAGFFLPEDAAALLQAADASPVLR